MSHPVRRTLVPISAYAGLLLITFTCASNYRWQSSWSDSPYGADFLQEWVGGRMILMGHAGKVYDAEAFRTWQHEREILGFQWDDRHYFPPVYPPLHYSLFTLLAWIPYRWGATLWVAILWGWVFLNGRWIAAIACSGTDESAGRTPLERLASEWGWLAILLFPVVPISVMFGQKSLIWLGIFVWTLRLLQTQRPVRAGLVFALLSLKPTLFFLIPVLMACRGQWRFVVGCAGGLLSLWGLAWLLLPSEMWHGYLATLAQAADYGTQGGYRADWSCSVWSIAKAWPPNLQAWIAALVCIPLIAYLLFEFLRRRSDPLDPPILFVMVCATMLLAPHAYHYDLCILLLPIGWMAATRSRFAIATYGALALGISSASLVYSLIPIPVLPIVLWTCALVWVREPKAFYQRERKENSGQCQPAMAS